MSDNHTYEEGIRDGRIASLETSVKGLATDLNKLTSEVHKLQAAIWMLYGAIFLVTFLPDVKRMFGGE